MGVFGFVVGSGVDGDGGIPDLDLLGGIGDHRSIFTHSIIAGATIETFLLSTAELARVVHPNLPDKHDPLWEDLIDKSEPLLEALSQGMSAGISYHLGVDATLDSGGTYSDLPVSMPQDAHTAVVGVNAATEGLDAVRRESRDKAESADEPRKFGTFKEAAAAAKASPGSRIVRSSDGGFLVREKHY